MLSKLFHYNILQLTDKNLFFYRLFFAKVDKKHHSLAINNYNKCQTLIGFNKKIVYKFLVIFRKSFMSQRFPG